MKKQTNKNVVEISTIKNNETAKLGIGAVSNSSGVIRTERGWAGHFIGAASCYFRRNTLLSYKDIKIVVSTVGLMEINGKFEKIGVGRYYETMAFHSKYNDTRYHDADVSMEIGFESPWAISELDADDKANEMHEAVVDEISNKLKDGYTF